jgi:hypothetical protein
MRGVTAEMAALLVGLCLMLVPAMASAPPCSQGVAAYMPCELSFDWNDNEVPPGASPYKDELLNVEFRSPRAKTYLMRGFWDGGRTVRVRFTPTEEGEWAYHVTSGVKRFNDQEGLFAVSASSSPGYIAVANLRHWWTDNKQPHLWFAAEVPWLDLSQADFQSWVDARKADGFTHIRGALLMQKAGKPAPLSSKLQPNFAYFATLDDRLLYAQSKGMVLDLMFADNSFVGTGALEDWETRQPLIHYLISRYSALNVTWQGVQSFELRIGTRAVLKEIGDQLKRQDSYRHPRSSGSSGSAASLLPDGWMNYIVEGSPHPEVGAIEHQLTTLPMIHVVNAWEPGAFRRELWQASMSTEYPSVGYQALQNPANVAACRAWFKVISNTRHWETEPYFDVDGGMAMGLDEAEYVLYADKPGHIEVSLPKHKYQPYWLNPTTGDTIDVKDYKGEIFSQETPDSSHDWVLHVQREGHKEGLLKSYKFESQEVPVYEVETDPEKTVFAIALPSDDEIDVSKPVPYQVKLRRTTRATRSMQYVWTGEIVADDEGVRVLATGAWGTFNFPVELIRKEPAILRLNLIGLNANGKAYSLDKVVRLAK